MNGSLRRKVDGGEAVETLRKIWAENEPPP